MKLYLPAVVGRNNDADDDADSADEQVSGRGTKMCRHKYLVHRVLHNEQVISGL